MFLIPWEKYTEKRREKYIDMLIIILLSFKTRTAVYFRPPVFLYFFKFILWRDRSIQISKLKIIVEDKKKKLRQYHLRI